MPRRPVRKPIHAKRSRAGYSPFAGLIGSIQLIRRSIQGVIISERAIDPAAATEWDELAQKLDSLVLNHHKASAVFYRVLEDFSGDMCCFFHETGITLEEKREELYNYKTRVGSGEHQKRMDNLDAECSVLREEASTIIRSCAPERRNLRRKATRTMAGNTMVVEIGRFCLKPLRFLMFHGEPDGRGPEQVRKVLTENKRRVAKKLISALSNLSSPQMAALWDKFISDIETLFVLSQQKDEKVFLAELDKVVINARAWSTTLSLYKNALEESIR